MSLYLKWTAPGRVPSYQGGTPLPEPGEWTETVADPVICQRGWHACRWEDVPAHFAAELWICELDGKIVAGGDKVAAERLRLVEQVPLDDRILRLWAADCAEAVLHLFEAERPDDDRPRRAIEAARAYANGDISAVAGAAAGAAAWAAGAAARDAAWAAGAAARDAAWAAGAAAWAAAWAAARDAGAAARDAARAAAGAAARAAAWAAARDAGAAQSDRLLAHYLALDPSLFAHRGPS